MVHGGWMERSFGFSREGPHNPDLVAFQSLTIALGMTRSKGKILLSRLSRNRVLITEQNTSIEARKVLELSTSVPPSP